MTPVITAYIINVLVKNLMFSCLPYRFKRVSRQLVFIGCV